MDTNMMNYAILCCCLVALFQSAHGYTGPACPGMREQGVVNQTVRIPRMEVPAQETTYMCSHFKFPEDANHLIAYTPDIQNLNFPHHIIITGCTRKENKEPTYDEAFVCNMESEDCTEIIMAWSVGDTGAFCLPPNIGFRVGDGGFTYGQIEIHWNNPAKISGEVDNSGLTLYMTPNLREHEAGILTVGQLQLEIPYGVKMHEEKATCSSLCTNKIMKGPVNVFGAFNHMHLAGASARSQKVTPDNYASYLAVDDVYSYNKPKVHVYNDPVVVEPGDRIEVFCYYNSTSRHSTVSFGLSTQDEMCFSFVMYYPRANIMKPSCNSWQKLDMCQIEEGGVNGCQFDRLATDPQILKLYQDLFERCHLSTCLKECKTFLKEMQRHECFRPDLMEYYKWYTNYTDISLTQAQLLMRSCDTEFLQERLELQYMNRDTSAATVLSGSYFSIMAGVMLLFMFVIRM